MGATAVSIHATVGPHRASYVGTSNGCDRCRRLLGEHHTVRGQDQGIALDAAGD